MKIYGPRAVRWPAYLPPSSPATSLLNIKGPQAMFLGLVEANGDRCRWLIVYQP